MKELVLSSGFDRSGGCGGSSALAGAVPGHLTGRAPRNEWMQYPPDPPGLGEIVVVMRLAGTDRHGLRLGALIAVLWRGGLRISETTGADRDRLLRGLIGANLGAAVPAPETTR